MPISSLPSEYARILNDLNRDVLRARPLDPLQFCANWFNSRLEAERKTVLLTAQQHQQGISPAPSIGVTGPSGSIGAASVFGAGAAAGGASAFGASMALDHAPPSPSSAPDSFLPPASFNLARRTSVSAESLAPGSISGVSGGPDDADDAPTKTVIPKSDSQMQRIRSSISNNLLFRNLEDDQYTDVLLAMKEVKVEADHPVIVQGDQGDYFYIVEAGNLDVYIRKDAPAITDGSAMAKLDRSNLGEKKVSYGPGDSFGELALLYAQPRAATIISTSPCTLWALDRVTFRSILMETNFRRRSMYESLLKDVSLFESLSPAEIAKISDALEPRTFEPGEYVFKQGERGTEFFIIWEGAAEVKKKRSDGTEDSVGTLSRGDYFGELALLNNAPRAASIVAASSGSGEAPARLRVATLSEQAFTRLLGPLAGIMSRHAETHYGSGPSPTDMLSAGGPLGSGRISPVPGARLGGGLSDAATSAAAAAAASTSGVGAGAAPGAGGYPFGASYGGGGVPHHSPFGHGHGHGHAGVAQHGMTGSVDPTDPMVGTWAGGSPFGASPFGAGVGAPVPPPAAAAGGPLSGYSFGQGI
ncbi:hypothetical protein OC845_001708 [Tilletia horrida]|nr:hypothetical protein OC845_001708 [Tilletia horrida]